MRYLAMIILLAGCFDTEVGWRKVGSKKLTGDWVSMGIPAQGGDVRRSDADGLIIAFPKGSTSSARHRRRARTRRPRTSCRRSSPTPYGRCHLR